MIKEILNYTAICDNCGVDTGNVPDADFDTFDSPETAKEYFLEIGGTEIEEKIYCSSCLIGNIVDDDRTGIFTDVPVEKRMFTQNGKLLPNPSDENPSVSDEVGIFIPFRKERYKGYYNFISKTWFVTLWNTDILDRLCNISIGLDIELNKITKVYYHVKDKDLMSMEDVMRLQSLGFPVIKSLATLNKMSHYDTNNLIASGKVDFIQFKKLIHLVTSKDGVFHELMKAKNKFSFLPPNPFAHYFETKTEDINSFFLLK